MSQDKSLPDASFIAQGSKYHGIFRLPHGRWQTLVGKDKAPIPFDDAISATRAAMARMNRILFPPIVAERATDTVDPAADKLLAEITAFKYRRETERREDRRILRNPGRKSVVVETRRRGA